MFHLTGLLLHPDDACDIKSLGFALQNFQAAPFRAGPGSAKRVIIACFSFHVYITPLFAQITKLQQAHSAGSGALDVIVARFDDGVRSCDKGGGRSVFPADQNTRLDVATGTSQASGLFK
jgi:hypothetical protein